MKYIYIIRHAKSSWKDETLKDFDRPLSKRGKKDTPLMANILKKLRTQPDIILSSPAQRAKITTQIIADELKCNELISYENELYEADKKTILKKIEQQNSNIKTLFLIGHNPGLNELLDELVDFNQNLPTCAIVVLEADCDKFSEIKNSVIKMRDFYYPKMFKLD